MNSRGDQAAEVRGLTAQRARPPVSPCRRAHPFSDISKGRSWLCSSPTWCARRAGRRAPATWRWAGALPGHRTFAAVGAGRRALSLCDLRRHPSGGMGDGRGRDRQPARSTRSPIASSAGGAAVDFSAGLKTVALTVSADWFAARDERPRSTTWPGWRRRWRARRRPAHDHAFAALTGKPTTLAGYGITDAAAAGHGHDDAYQPARCRT